jgi:hypothetical protein
VATWSTPIVIQLVFGVFLAAMLVLGKFGFPDNDHVAEGHKVLAASGVAVVISLVAAALSFAGRGSTARGLRLGTAASAAIFLIGAGGYVLWLG